MPMTGTEPNILINVGLFCSGAQSYHRTVRGHHSRNGPDSAESYGAICLFGSWGVTSLGFELKTKVFLVALLVPSWLCSKL